MREFLNGMDPATRRGMLVAATVVLPLASLVGSMLVGYVVGYMRERPEFSRIASVLLVGILTLAVAGAGATLWWYMHAKYGWFPGRWGWGLPALWVVVATMAFKVPKRNRAPQPEANGNE